MKKTTTFLFAVAILISTASFSQSWEWAKKVGSSGIDEGININADSYGNTLITGSFSDTVNFGSTQLISNAYSDMFFAKLDSSGAVLWAKQFGGASTDYGCEMIADSLGNYYLLGMFQDTILIGMDTLISAGMKEMLIAKLDSNLNVVWAKRAGGAGIEDPFSIKLDQWGNVYAITPFQGTAYFDADSLVSQGSFDIALLKYDNNGNVIWAKGAGGTGIDVPVSISIDLSGNVIMSFPEIGLQFCKLKKQW